MICSYVMGAIGLVGPFPAAVAVGISDVIPRQRRCDPDLEALLGKGACALARRWLFHDVGSIALASSR